MLSGLQDDKHAFSSYLCLVVPKRIRIFNEKDPRIAQFFNDPDRPYQFRPTEKFFKFANK